MQPRRVKSTVLLAGIVVNGLTLIAWTQGWFVITLVPGLAGGEPLLAGGDVAAGGLAALGLAGLALVGALSIAGPVFRIVLGVLQVLIGVTVTLSTVVAIGEPVQVSSRAITEATGVAGTDSVGDLVDSVAVQFWPWLAAVLGVAGIVLGVLIVLLSRRFPASSRKYQTVRFEAADADAHGRDGDTTAESGPASPREADTVADWDALSDGTDPTSR